MRETTPSPRSRAARVTLATAAALLMTIALPAVQDLAPAQKGGSDLTGPYAPVADWFKPLHDGRRQCVVSVFADTPDRIYLVTEVEVAETFAAGNCAAERTTPGVHRHFILVVNGRGEVIEDWSQWNELFGAPHSVKISPYDPERAVWIVNSDGHQVYKFSRDGRRLLLTLGEKDVSGEDAGHFNRPTDIAFFSDGSFLVADGYNNARLVKFDVSGRFVAAWGGRGSGPGQFRVPHGIAIDGQSRVYVADRDNERIQVLDANGRSLDEWPRITGVVAVIAAADGAVWALTGSTNRILKYDRDGRLQTYWGTANTGDPFAGSLHAPHAFSVDPAGNLYVADYRNHRVQKFVPGIGADPRRLIAPARRPPALSAAGADLSWAFTETDGVLPREDPATTHRLDGSSRIFTRAEIDDVNNAVDWFPDGHPPAPAIVRRGHGTASACGVCHLASGFGHPQSADITGLPIEYFQRTMREFRDGTRVEPNHMNEIARDLSDEEIRDTSEYYARLPVTRWTEVREAAMVPATWMPRGRMRLAQPTGARESIGTRIITLPRDPLAASKRDPRSGFIAYVPPGSIARGRLLATTGGGVTVPCGSCHGASMNGAGAVPRLAGVHPVYLARQLYLFQDGRRHGPEAARMQSAVARLRDRDIVDLAAYLGSLEPSPEPRAESPPSAARKERTRDNLRHLEPSWTGLG